MSEEHHPRAKARLIADAPSTAYLGLLYDYDQHTRLPFIRRGIVRTLRAKRYPPSLGSTVHVALGWDPNGTSFNNYLILLKLIIRYLDNRDCRITIIWPLYARYHSPPEQEYLRKKASKFMRWVNAKRLLIQVLVPQEAIPAINVRSYRGDPKTIYGEDFLTRLNGTLPSIPGQHLPASYPVATIPTVPLDQNLANFISMKLA